MENGLPHQSADWFAMTYGIRWLSEVPGDCHTSGIGHWFAMTPYHSGLFRRPNPQQAERFCRSSIGRPGDSQGGGFSAVPLEPASYQFSCRDKKIAPGGNRTESFYKAWNTRVGFIASLPSSVTATPCHLPPREGRDYGLPRRPPASSQ